jgi:hypothetical protein
MSSAALGSNFGTDEDDSGVELLPAVGEVVVAPRTGPKVVATPKRKMIRIRLEENDNIPPTGQFFGHNGASYMLRPGEDAEVPVELINVLNDAVMAVPQVDPTTRQVLGYRERLRFPYRVIARDL